MLTSDQMSLIAEELADRWREERLQAGSSKATQQKPVDPIPARKAARVAPPSAAQKPEPEIAPAKARAGASPENRRAPAHLASPAGGGEVGIGPGDCLAGLALRSGHHWMTLWNDPANQELKSARRDPNFLMVGDRLQIPPLRSRVEVGHTGSTCHRFVRKGLPNLVHIRFMADGSPLAGQNFRATLSTGRRLTGSLDQEGSLSLSLSESATSVRVMIGNETPMEFSFALGALQPADSHEGIRQRLANLGVLEQGA